MTNKISGNDSPTSKWVVSTGTCSCGSCTVETYSKPITTVNCHCTTCQRNYNADYGTVGIYWIPATSVTYNGSTIGEMAHHDSTGFGGLVGVHRYKCPNKHCNNHEKPFIGIGTRAYTGLFFIPPDLMRSTVTQEKEVATVNVFYASGKHRGTMGLPTIHSDIGTLLYFVGLLVVKGLPQLVVILIRAAWMRICCEASKEKKNA